MSPSISRWRTHRYSQRILNVGGAYEPGRLTAWRTPSRSKWSIMNVAASAINQPTPYAAQVRSRQGCACMSQSVPSIGCHFRCRHGTIVGAGAVFLAALRGFGYGVRKPEHRRRIQVIWPSDWLKYTCCSITNGPAGRRPTNR